jgi:hypothetical protein
MRVQGVTYEEKVFYGGGMMNRSFNVTCVTVTAFLASMMLAVAFTSQYQPFPGANGGVPVDGGTWTFGTGCLNTNVVSVSANDVGSKALSVPPFNSATNNTGAAGGGKVWTDFWTAPVPYSDGLYPAIDPNATAQVYLNFQSKWVAFSGNGSGGYRTNVLSAVTAPDATGYYRVNILSDYGNKTYSLSVNNSCIGTNLPFICDLTAGPADRWFIAQNLAGSAACLLDEYRFDTKLTGVLTGTVPGGGLSDYNALLYFNTPAPRPVATNATIITGTQVAWKFKVDGIGTSSVLGGTTTSSITTPIGSLNANGQFTNTVGTSKYFYRVIRRSSENPAIAVTNAEIYAAYKQDRTQLGTYYIGAPVDMLDGDRSLSGTLGRQLAVGLVPGDAIKVYSGGHGDLYTLTPSGWSGVDGVTNAAGQAVKIIRQAAGAATSTIIAGTVPTNTVAAITLSPGWNAVTWPYESNGSLAGFHNLTASSGSALGDYILLQTNTTQILVGYYSEAGGWKANITPLAGSVFNPTLPAGSGMLIYRTGGGNPTWAPTLP